ncbi:hypothetical protein FGG08_001083 [Glutinoglossum americanum]|uniref:Uncharacterized protein n=1 Tax=Glutinoglossum americanum TaxID=1670608 RepID=A0A9P8I7U1_9PEZI|nr:hypothetical protein FGG08_001083 [Glutinoglossum americanum]
MEHLALHDTPPPPPGQNAHPPPPPPPLGPQQLPQLPPQMFTTAAQLLDLTDSEDLDKEDDIPAPFQKAPLDQVLALQKEEKEERKRNDKTRHRKLMKLGFEGDNLGEALL